MRTADLQRGDVEPEQRGGDHNPAGQPGDLRGRPGDVQRGGDGSLIKSGEAVMKKFSGARNAGKADAQVSVSRQKRAGVSRSTAPTGNSSNNDVEQRIRSGDPNAIAGVLSGWITDGKI